MRIIYDERRRAMFVLAGLLVVGLIVCGILDVSAITFSFAEKALDKSLTHAEQLVAAVVFLVLLLVVLPLVVFVVTAIRITVDERGIKKLCRWDGDCFLIEWATVGSWRVESYDKASYEMGTRLVVEFASAEKRFVLEDPRYLTAVVAELSAVVPERYSRDVSATGQACMTTPDTLNLTAVVAEPSAVVPERYSRGVPATDQACMTPPGTLMHSGFSWVEGAEGYRLDFPPRSYPNPYDTFMLTMSLCTIAVWLGTLAVVIIVVFLEPHVRFEKRLPTVLNTVLGLAGLAFMVTCFGVPVAVIHVLLERPRQRSEFNRSFAYLDIGPEFVTVASRDGRERRWRRAAIHFVKQVLFSHESSESVEVMLCFHDGSSLSLGVGLDRAGGEWLTTTLRQVLGLTSPVEFEFSGLQEQLKGVIHRKKP